MTATGTLRDPVANEPCPSDLAPDLDTFPKLARRNAGRWPSKVAIREKDYGIWQSFTWRDYLEQARLIALGLASLGLGRGLTTAIIGANRPQRHRATQEMHELGRVT